MLSNKNTTVVGYIPKKLKRRMEEAAREDRRLNLSRQVEEALTEWHDRRDQALLDKQRHEQAAQDSEPPASPSDMRRRRQDGHNEQRALVHPF